MRRSAWVGAESCGSPRSGACGRLSWPRSGRATKRWPPSSSTRSASRGASGRAHSSCASEKRSRNAASATIASSDRPKEDSMTATEAARALAEGFSGEVLVAAQPGYDEARHVFNAMIDRRPAVIARGADTADVARAVDVARESGLVVAVRCGGHSVAGLGVCDDGMLIDLSGLKSIAVDPTARTATAGGGVLWGEF